ncbi:MAG: sulfatase [Saprospiraceae bacterium]|nr:sulfatase [Saprospiraceae bacterium]
MKKIIPLLLIASYLCLALSFQTSNDDFKKKHPNILWITVEDMSHQHLGCYGGKVTQTPFIDQLAKESMRYTNVFSTAGVCAPSRSAIITGMYQTSAGSHNMRTLNNAATSKSSPVPGYSAVIPDDARCFPEYLRKAGYYCTNNEKQDYQFEAPVTVWDENSKTADWRGRKTKNQPFFSIINLMTTHESQVFMREKEPLTVDPKQVQLPPFYPDNEIIRTDVARFLTNVETMDKQVGEIIQKLKADGLYENTIIFFFSDHGDGLPFVKRELYDRGLKIPLLIRYPNGKDGGKVDDQLLSFVDFAPTILSLANIPIPKYIQGQAFLGKQKSKQKRQYIYAARDRMDTEYDRVRAVSDGRFKYLKNYMPEKPYYQDIQYRLSQKSMVEILRLRDEGKLDEVQMYWFRKTKPDEELFDVYADPYELHNLANEPQYQDKLMELRKQHLDWIKTYGDLGAIPEKELISKWWNGLNGPPKTQTPILEIKQGKIILSCVTKGASIAFKKHWNDKSWEIYDFPIQEIQGDSLYVVAHRIGYEQSDVVILKNEDYK